MAFTGFLLIGFIFLHMIGNWQVFLGPDVFNAYGALIQGIPGPLWVLRIVLLAALLTHMYLAITLSRENWQARPVAYANSGTIQATITSRAMGLTGLMIFAFVVYHLLHFTTGTFYSDYYNSYDAQGRHDIYSMLVLGFREPVVTISYILAMVLLAMHLHHAVQSIFQTMGWAGTKSRSTLKRLSAAFAVFIFIGYIIIPLAVILGILRLPVEM